MNVINNFYNEYDIKNNEKCVMGSAQFTKLRGPNPYPILGKAGLRKHTLF